MATRAVLVHRAHLGAAAIAVGTGNTHEAGTFIGRGAWQLSGRLRYGSWSLPSESSTASNGYTAHFTELGVGGSFHASIRPTIEGAVGADIAAGPLFQRVENTDRASERLVAPTLFSAARLRLTWLADWIPFPVHVDAFAGARVLPYVQDGSTIIIPTAGVLIGGRGQGFVGH